MRINKRIAELEKKIQAQQEEIKKLKNSKEEETKKASPQRIKGITIDFKN